MSGIDVSDVAEAWPPESLADVTACGDVAWASAGAGDLEQAAKTKALATRQAAVRATVMVYGLSMSAIWAEQAVI